MNEEEPKEETPEAEECSKPKPASLDEDNNGFDPGGGESGGGGGTGGY